MTPMAKRFFKQLLLPPHKRPPDPDRLLRYYEDLHCFDVTPLGDTVEASLKGHDTEDLLNSLPGPHFLPSPATWLEMDFDCGTMSMLAVEDGPGFDVSINTEYHIDPYPFVMMIRIGLCIPPRGITAKWTLPPERQEGFGGVRSLGHLFTMLDIINTPGIVRLTEGAVHRGFARTMKNAGYPLRAWHEVKIDPKAIKTVTKNNYTPAFHMPLHFVRSHRRRVWQQDVVIRAHWRGDPALGIEQTRYRVDPS